MRNRSMFLLGMIVAGVVAGASGGVGCRPPDPLGPVAARLEDDFGIRVESVRLAAAGGMIDVRYRVLDPGKAAAFQKRGTLPHLVSVETGLRLSVPSFPKAGPMRQSPQRAVAGQVYFLLFRNLGGSLHSDDRVVLEMGGRKSAPYTLM